jgi:hypothetical protein
VLQFAVDFDHGFGKQGDGLVDLLVGHDQGGEKADHVFAGADQQ